MGTAIADYVTGAESDSGCRAQVLCPKCQQPHRVSLSRIGRFLYHCRGALVSGHVGSTETAALRAQAATS